MCWTLRTRLSRQLTSMGRAAFVGGKESFESKEWEMTNRDGEEASVIAPMALYSTYMYLCRQEGERGKIHRAPVHSTSVQGYDLLVYEYADIIGSCVWRTLGSCVWRALSCTPQHLSMNCTQPESQRCQPSTPAGGHHKKKA